MSQVASAPRPGYWWHGSAAWWPALVLLRLFVATTAVTAVFLLVRRTARTSSAQVAEAKLAERYAAGVITEDEYWERLAVLCAAPQRRA
ncbi:MAG TPA: SHOCT domain-containing protein [Streptosporangiaceae bacterium]